MAKFKLAVELFELFPPIIGEFFPVIDPPCAEPSSIIEVEHSAFDVAVKRLKVFGLFSL